MASMQPWLVQHLRTTLFTLRPKAVEEAFVESLFSELTGIPPETDEWRAGRTLHRRTGSNDGVRFELLEQPSRLDLTRLGPVNLDIAAIEGGVSAAALGGLDALDQWMAIAPKMYAKSSDVVRIAIGGLLFLPAETGDESYNTLQALVPRLDLNINNVSDFMLQINQFTQSSCRPALRINRLSTLASIRLGMIIPSLGGSQDLSSGYFTQLTPDINTAMENQEPFDSDTFNIICNELKEGLLYVAEGVR